MRKSFLCFLFIVFSIFVSAQCTISPFIQQNYEFDAKVLAFREIQSNPNDPDYNSLFVPTERVTPYLEKLSAIYENPNNFPEIDSLFNEFQFHTNTHHGYSFTDLEVNELLRFRVNTAVSWVQTLKDTGVSGFAALDNLMATYQLAYDSHYDYSFDNTTVFYLKTNYDLLNIRVIIPEFEALQDIFNVSGDTQYPLLGSPYMGIPYTIMQSPIGPTEQADLCGIKVLDDGTYEFWLGGGDCFNGCIAKERRYVTVSNDCNTVNFSRTLSMEDFLQPTVSIFPNPVSHTLHIQGITEIQTLEIFTMTGKKVHFSQISDSQIDVQHLSSGMYFLKITDVQQRSIVKKFLK